MLLAGDEGFEPPITGPEPVALPLGQSPLANCGTRAAVAVGATRGDYTKKLAGMPVLDAAGGVVRKITTNFKAAVYSTAYN